MGKPFATVVWTLSARWFLMWKLEDYRTIFIVVSRVGALIIASP